MNTLFFASRRVCNRNFIGRMPRRAFAAAGDSAMIVMKNAEEWETYLNSETPIVLQAGADWCGPCKSLKPMLNSVAKRYVGKV